MQCDRPTHLMANRPDQSLRDEAHSIECGPLPIAKPRSEENYRAKSWLAITHGAALLPFLFLVAWAWVRSDLNGLEIPDWRPVLALADAARGKGELYKAKSLYSEAGKLAARRDDWAGLLAIACGMKRLEMERGPRSSVNTVLLRAMIAAEASQSRPGLVAVSKAFTALGKDKVASMVLSRMRDNWVDATDESVDVVSPACWDMQTNAKIARRAQ
jgi:hypothetical protein